MIEIHLPNCELHQIPDVLGEVFQKSPARAIQPPMKPSQSHPNQNPTKKRVPTSKKNPDRTSSPKKTSQKVQPLTQHQNHLGFEPQTNWFPLLAEQPEALHLHLKAELITSMRRSFSEPALRLLGGVWLGGRCCLTFSLPKSGEEMLKLPKSGDALLSLRLFSVFSKLQKPGPFRSPVLFSPRCPFASKARLKRWSWSKPKFWRL